MIHSRFLHIPENGIFFLHFHNVRVIFHCGSMSNFFLFSFAANDSLSFHLLGIVNAAEVHFCGVGVWACFPWSVGFSNALWLEPLHDILCPILWFQVILTILPINALVAYLPLVAYKGCFTNIALLFLVYRVLDNGLIGFSLVLLHCSLIFRITDYEANEAHFQRLLSKHWPAFTCWSFLPYRVVCSCFYFGVLPLAIL